MTEPDAPTSSPGRTSATYLLDADFCLVHVDAPSLVDAGGLIGRRLDEVADRLWAPERRDEITRRFRRTLETGMPFAATEPLSFGSGRDASGYEEWRIDRITLPDRRHGVVGAVRDVSQHVRAGRSLADSEARYRALFDSVDDGFCVIEVLFDGDDPVDVRFLEANPAFERHTGLSDVIGKRLRDIAPAVDPSRFERYVAVARSGDAQRFETEATALGGRVLDVYAFRFGGADSCRVGVLFRDVSDRRRVQAALRRSEERQAFLLALSDALRPLAEPIAIKAEATRILAERLGGSRSLYVEVDEGGDSFLAERDHHVPGAPAVAGRHRLDAFGPESMQRLRAGDTLVDTDVQASTVLDPEHRAAYAAMGVGAHVSVPLVKEGRLVALLSIHAATARDWTPDEVALVEETADRTWAAVERARAEAALRESEEKYRSLFESMDEGFFLTEVILDEDGRPVDILCLEANPAATRMVGHDFAGRRLSEFDPRFEPSWIEIWGRVARTGQGVRLERFVEPLGAWYDFYAFSVGERGSRRVAIVFQDVSARKEIEEELRSSRAELLHRAHHDRLTGLPNRVLFVDRLRLAVASAARRERILAVLFVDLDGFKFVNDSLGHAAGDHVLEVVASRLRASLREEDTLARLHGDEFVVLLPEINDPDDAEYLARTLNAAVSQPVDVGDKPVALSASIGISVYPRDGTDADALLRSADVAMYHVKLQGKNGGRFFEGSMRAPAEERVALGEHFDGALERNELAVHYQPQWDSRTGRIAAFEALLRWTSPLLGEVSPTRFVPIAEERGAFGSVASWTLDECGAAAVVLSPASGLPCRIALNVTPARLARASFVSRVEATTRWHGIEPRQLELELSGVPQTHEAVGLEAAIERLKAMGVRVTLDRFRADAGMVALLLDLALDGVKIEPPMVDRAARDPRLRRGLEAMIALVHDLGLDVTAVGIETEAQRDVMLALGCDRLQGYYVGPPTPWSEALALVEGQQVATLFS